MACRNSARISLFLDKSAAQLWIHEVFPFGPANEHTSQEHGKLQEAANDLLPSNSSRTGDAGTS
jgi:hypothetical protein